MSEEKNERRVPKLRFKGFTDDWMQYPLDEITDVYDGTHQTPNYTDSGIKFLSVENISNLETTKYISEEDFKKDFKIYPTFGDVLMTRIGSIGVTNIVEKDELLAYYVSLALLKPHNDNGLFIKYLIDSSKVQKELWRRTLHIAFPKKINKNEIGKVKVNIPLNDEQDKISNLLKKIDSLIALEQEKSHYLRKIYKDLVQLLLIADETKSPKIRLKGYSAKWELTRVSDIFEITRGKVLAKEEVSDIKTTEYKYPVYSSQTLNHGLMGYYNEYLFENAITWTTDGANAGTVNLRSGKFYSTNVNGVLLSDEGFACKAVAEIINNTAYKYVSHVGNPKLMNNVMADIPIYIPNDPKELEALSPIFINLEYKITLVENIISKYKSIRTYLLNNLFV